MGEQSGLEPGYFVTVPVLRRPAEPARGPELLRIPLVRGSGPRMGRSRAVLAALGGLAWGLGFFAGIELMSALSSLWGSGADYHVFAIAGGSSIAAAGICGAVLMWKTWSRETYVEFAEDEARISYPGFVRPLVVPRALLRVAAVDETPVRLFANNPRFPVTGDVPDEAFADALDRHPAPPWDPGTPRPGAGTGPTLPAHFPNGEYDVAVREDAYLFSAHGAALHVLRVNPEDVPNVALVFHDPLRTPRAPAGMWLAPPFYVLAGRRLLRGAMVRVADPEGARRALADWGVLRPVTSHDVVEEGLRLPKPLRGWRIAAYAALVVGPLLVALLRRML